ncbi:MAG: NADAR family protein [Bacteroidota bacterium]
MEYSLERLIKEIDKGIHHDYLFFWGHTQKKESLIDKSCFSQWFPSPFTVDGIVYPTAEHWMMAKKAELFNDNKIVKEILATEKPAVAKELGRKVSNFDAEKWNASSYKIVVEGNKQKFSQNEKLKTFLLHTGSKVLVEASPADAVWGIGLSQSDADALNPLTWKGNNLLGFALMEVRNFLNNNNGQTIKTYQ